MKHNGYQFHLESHTKPFQYNTMICLIFKEWITTWCNCILYTPISSLTLMKIGIYFNVLQHTICIIFKHTVFKNRKFEVTFFGNINLRKMILQRQENNLLLFMVTHVAYKTQAAWNSQILITAVLKCNYG